MNRWEWLAEQAILSEWTCGAELGVKEGQTLYYLLEHCPALHMIGVDLWATNNAATDGYGYNDWDHAANEAAARLRATEFGPRVRLIKGSTLSAADAVEDKSLDFVFIDACHDEASVAADIAAWKDKVRPGGILCGHDANWPTVRMALDSLLPDAYKLIEHDRMWIHARPK